MDLVSPELSVPERLTQIERVLGDIHGRLFGNGQPGELASMKAENSARFKALWKAVDSLRTWRWQVTGGLAVIIAVFELAKEWMKKT